MEIVIILICFFCVVFGVIFQHQKNVQLLLTVTDLDRGTPSERRLVLKLLKSGIPADHIFHDLYVQNPNNTFSQIDLVIITETGIIVFEVKDYSGWLFGKGNQSQWTQVLDFGNQKFRFYNPVMQNAKHITDLKKYLPQTKDIPFYSVIIFYGNCALKNISLIPKETFVAKSYEINNIMDIIT